MVSIAQLFEWFATGKFPTASQFAEQFKSYWHKSEKLPIEQIFGLKEEIDRVTTKFKGYYSTLADLQTAYPQTENKKDFYAFVGSPYPGTVWKVKVDGGAWTDTGEVPSQEQIDLTEYAKTTTSDGKVVRTPDGTVDLPSKADKVLTDSSPVTYFKSASGGASEDLTATLRASITPVVWMNENQWFTGSATDSVNAYFRLYDSTLEGQIAKRAAVKLQLAPNTWYEVTGLNNPMAKYTFDPAQWVNDRGTIPLVSGNMPMGQNNPPTALLTALRATGTASDQGYGALELIYSRYGESFRFKTGTTAQWLIILVRCDDSVAIKKATADTENYYFFPEWAFDSSATITLKKLSSDSANSSADRLVDSQNNLLKELDFDSVIDEKLNSIDGIVSGGDVEDNPELIESLGIPFIGGFQINSDGSVRNTGSGQYGYFDFIPVQGGKNYRIPRGFTFNQDTTQANIYFYNSAKVFVKNNLAPLLNSGKAGTFFAPEDGYLRINMNSYSWANPNTSNKNLYKGVSLAWAEKTNADPHVSVSSDNLTDAEPTTVNGVSGIIIPKLFIPQANIITSGGGDSTYTINMRNTSTFVGSFNTAIDQIVALYPKARHIFVGHFSYDGVEGNGWLRPMIETQRAMCENRSIPYIDLASVMGWTHNDNNVIEGVDYNNLRKFTSDYTHPCVDTTQVMANLLADRLTILLRPFVKSGEIVANIGDSVSAGYTGLPSGAVAWARYIERALIAIGCTVKLYASSGGALRATTTDGGAVNNGFMANTDPNWGFTKDVINNIGTANQPNVYLWELGHNDFTADDRDFKLIW